MICFVSAAVSDRTPHQLMPALWLASRGHAVTCVVPGREARSQLASPIASVPCVVVPSAGRAGLGWHVRLAWTILRQRLTRPGETVFYVMGSPTCPAALLGLLALPAGRIVYHTQDFLEPGRHLIWEWCERRLARKAGAVVCNEPSRARFMASHYGLRSVPLAVRTALPREWPAPAPDPRLRAQLLRMAGRADDDQVVAIWAGGPPSPVRRSRELMEAVARLPDHYIVVFSGLAESTPEREAAEQAIAAAGISRRAVLLGLLPFGQVLEYTAVCDVGVLLYPNDGVGNYFQAPGRLTEYLAVGLPSVSSDHVGLELLMLKHGIGQACDGASPDDIARAIRHLAERSPEVREAERARLRALAKNEFAFDVQAARIESLVGGGA